MIKVTLIDWGQSIIQYHYTRSLRAPKSLKMLSLNYVLMDEKLYKKGFDSLLICCVGLDGIMEIIKLIHEGMFDVQQLGIKMHLLIRRHGYY